jgi:hypothetical protein
MIQEAISELTTAELDASNNPQINYHLGLAYYSGGDIDGAYRKLKAAVNTRTTFPEIDEAKKILQEVEAKRSGE